MNVLICGQTHPSFNTNTTILGIIYPLKHKYNNVGWVELRYTHQNHNIKIAILIKKWQIGKWWVSLSLYPPYARLASNLRINFKSMVE
jgi:hypothetical protein